MFDTVFCDKKLPTSILHDGGLQTKGLENGLHTYTIHKDGTMWRSKFVMTQNAASKPVRVYMKDKKFTMYDYNRITNRRDGAWIEYEVTFKNNRVTKIELTKFEKIS